MQQHRILMLSQTNKDDYALMEWKKNGIDVGITLREYPLVLRVIRRYWLKYHLPFESIWYGAWKKKLLDYDCIILHGTYLAEDIPAWMKKQASKANKELRIIWWYWNSVTDKDHPDRVSEFDCEKWSFDRKDCELYSMKHNTQYYFKSFQLPEKEIKNDVYFLGTDAGRKEQLIQLYKIFEEYHLKPDFHILVSKLSGEDMNVQECFITKPISYQENLEHIAESKAVLEILRKGQNGQTLRALECLFYHKKLITNDIRVKEYDYYHPNNIFILGFDDLDRLPIFLEENFAKISGELIEKYDCKMWLERFNKL